MQSLCYPTQVKFSILKHKFQHNQPQKSVLVMSCHAILSKKKNGQLSKASVMQDFKVKCNRQTPKDAKLHPLQNGYLRFSKFY